MKNYLSFGGGVNSVALYLLMQDLGIDFEAVFVNHGGDWPETYQYVDYFIASGRPVTVLRPDVKTRDGLRFDNLVDYYQHMRITPSRRQRICTDKFKIRTLEKYQQAPAWVFIGFAADESKRATMSSKGGFEYRWPLIEHGITRQGCIDMIKAAGLDVPRKSGCYICPFQGDAEYRELRRKHPDLYCRARKIEEAQNARVAAAGNKWKPYHLASVSLRQLVDSKENQAALPGLESMEYPPCQCGL